MFLHTAHQLWRVLAGFTDYRHMEDMDALARELIDPETEEIPRWKFFSVSVAREERTSLCTLDMGSNRS